jgi:uncharacterized membrane protein (UPF0127 family)/Skp family chaperone for outer membrane proteins
MLSLCVFARSVHADEPRIASVDLKLAFSNLQETIDTQHDLADMQKQFDAMVKAHKDELTPADPKAAPKMSIEEQDAKELDFSLQEQTLKLKMIRKQCKEMAHAWGEIQDAVNTIAKARHLDLVLAGANPPLPLGAADIPNAETVGKMLLGRDFVYTGVDITADVIAALNKNYKSTAAPLPALPMTAIKIGSATYQMEIAGDGPSQEHGLMERDALPADHGMIFVFADVAYRNFWMHHTRFPLDILFADEHGKVVSIANMKPYDETGVPSDFPAKYALELPAGAAANVKVGDTISIPPAVDAALKK